MALTFEKLVKAYFDCRKRKRSSASALEFEFNLEENLAKLYDDLISGNYVIGESVCFVVKTPKPREVWAANFRDRIVHHLIYNEISNRFYRRFIKDTYSCIPKRGTTNAVKAVARYAKAITRDYTEEAYYLKADIKNFFVTINKDILFNEVKKLVPEEWILNLLKQIIYNDCREKVVMHASKSDLALLPKQKSLWYTSSDKGLPIGNLTSQFFSNVYLNVLDQYVKHHWRCKYYCRYVDDFVIMDKDPKNLNIIHKDLTKFLKERLELDLHQNKKEVNKIQRGIDFVGFVIRPHRISLRQKTLKRIFRIVKRQKAKSNWYEIEELKNFVGSINSYLGILRNTSGFKLREEICFNIINLLLACDFGFTKLSLCTV